MKQRLYEQIAGRFKAWLDENPSAPLPSIDALATQWNASYQTMRFAIRLLVKQGVLECSQGRSTRRAGMAANADSSAGKLFAKIKDAIDAGACRIGEALPKVDHFVISEHVSSATVVEAFSRLHNAGCAYRQGKKWLAGPGSSRPHPTMKTVRQSDGSPVLVVLFNYANDWSTFVSWPHAAGFSQPFIDEIDKYGMHMSIAAVSHSSAKASSLPTGIGEITALIRSLGNRYCGMLVAPAAPYKDGLPRILKAASSLGKPVVCFDWANICGGLTREAIASRKFYRLFFDERSALACALDRLRELGHTVVGVPIYTRKNYDWTTRRFGLLRDLAGNDGAIRLVGIDHREPFWHFEDPGDLHQFVSRVAARNRGLLNSRADNYHTILRDILIKETPSLASLLRDHQVTALIALSDRMAREYYFWLQSAGIAIPRELSVVSFDNHRESIVFPISTVDFGFSRLGYLAAHIFIDDIAVRVDSKGNMAGECRLRERGSLRAPRKKRLVM